MHTFEDNLKSDIRLNINNLEAEVQKQPGLYQYWAEQLAEKKAIKDRLETQLKVRSGEIDLMYRREGLPDGIKSTETSIKSAVESNPELELIRYDIIAAARDVGYHEATVRALDHKKAQIDNAVRLWLNAHFQDPKQAGRADNAEDAMRGHLNRNRNIPEEDS